MGSWDSVPQSTKVVFLLAIRKEKRRKKLLTYANERQVQGGLPFLPTSTYSAWRKITLLGMRNRESFVGEEKIPRFSGSVPGGCLSLLRRKEGGGRRDR